MNSIIFRHLWPHVPLHRCDSELELFTKYYTVLDHDMVRQFMTEADNENPKSENVAKSYRVKGNILYKDKSYKKALYYYNLSITRAPRDSVEFGLALGNRSAVFFDLESYKECLLDIQTILRSEYPEHLLFKVYMRQSKCFLQLNSYFEATKSLKKAQTSFDCSKARLSRVQIDDMTEKLADIKTRIEDCIRNDNPVANAENEDKLALPALKDGENPVFICASKAVDLKYNERLGRHVVANTKISTGDVLFVEPPYSCGRPEISDVMKIIEYCSQCFKQLICFIPCTTCSVYLYCSDTCRQQSWDVQHKWICPGARKDLLDNHMILALDTLFRASHTNFNTSIPDEKVYGNKDDNYPFFCKLLTHKQEIPMDALVECIKTAAWLVVYLTHFTGYFDWLYVQPARPEGSLKVLTQLIGGMLVKYILQLSCNAESVITCRTHMSISEEQYFFSMRYGANAAAQYVSSAMLNHSCVPNAAKSFYGNVKVIRAIKDIAKGTEITVSYIERKGLADDANDIAYQLRMQRFLFTCTCEKCSPVVTLQQQLNTAWLCGRCQGRVLDTPNELGYGKCHDCHCKVNLAEYKRQEWRLNELALLYDVTQVVNYLEQMLNIMKKMLHKHNVRFLPIYARLTQIYEDADNYKKCIAMDKQLDNLVKHLHGPTSLKFAMHHGTLCLVLTKYCNQLKMQKSQAHGKMMKQCNEICKETLAVLQYYVAQQDLDEYEQAVQQILAWDKPILPVRDNCFIEEL
ncbi:SET and MYND domain containing class 4 member 3 [Carabus blaptoides fortunei]